ncbi:MAG: Gfo/Idh/MocA family oxidoreductase [Anaerolineaceae bacterium]|nr:Gfo/Idh/MocA family oxidoreductase [Anaerolineaceae bacterium]
MTQTCKVAFVGAGYMGTEHVKAFADVPGVELSGIFSRTRERAEKLAAEHGIQAVYDSVEELYGKTRADLVVVTVVELSMNAVSKACFAFPWTVLLEKPAGHTMPDALDIHAAAEAQGRDVYVALNRRFYAATRAALADLSKIDGARFIKMQDQQNQAVALQYGQPEEVVANWMYANSIHMIDYFTAFGRGKVVEVENVFPWTPDDPGIVVSKLVFDSGDTGLYEGVWNGPGPWAATIQTAEKRWEMRPLEQAAFQVAGSRKLESVEAHPWDATFKPGLRLQAEHAVRAALGEENDSVTLEESLESMRLVQRIFGL